MSGTADWARRRKQQDIPQDGRIAALMDVYSDFTAQALTDAWAFYLDAYKKGSGMNLLASEEMMLWQSFHGVVALASRTMLPIATAVAVAAWHFSPKHQYDRPNL